MLSAGFILSNKLLPPALPVVAPAETPPPKRLDVCAGWDALVVALVFKEPKREGLVEGVGACRLKIDILANRSL